MASSTDADADVDGENCPEQRRARKRSQDLRKIDRERESGTFGKVGNFSRLSDNYNRRNIPFYFDFHRLHFLGDNSEATHNMSSS